MNKFNERYVRNKTELARVKAARQKGEKGEMQIMGSGPLNRDGVPRLPPEQKQVDRWPVLDMGVHPEVTLADWRLELSGLCARPQTLDFAGLQKLSVIEDTSDFHCVTGWSQLDLKWKGVRFSALAEHCGVLPDAKYVMAYGYDGYSTNLPLVEAMKYDVLITWEVNGGPLPREHGGPIRMITPQLWAWKGAKWIKGIEFLRENRRGFWEERGYSNSAIPWLNDRYTKDESSD